MTYSVLDPTLPGLTIDDWKMGAHINFPLVSFLKKNNLRRKASSVDVIVKNLGGIPTENFSTFIPTDLAAMK